MAFLGWAAGPKPAPQRYPKVSLSGKTLGRAKLTKAHLGGLSLAQQEPSACLSVMTSDFLLIPPTLRVPYISTHASPRECGVPCPK